MADAHPHNSARITRSHCPSSHTLSPMGGLMTVRANGDDVKQDVITGSRSPFGRSVKQLASDTPNGP